MARGFTGALVAALLSLAVPASALAEDWIYFDAHPVHPAAGGGFCELAGAHVHDYAPIDPAAFVRRDGLWFFVGDPVAYGYRGTVYRFVGSHEVPGSLGVAVCTMDGIHYHLYPPVVPEEAATAWVTPAVVDPWWWYDSRPPRRATPPRPHAFPVEPPPRAAPPRRAPPPTVMPPAPMPGGHPSARRPGPPPPPARRR